MLQTTFWESLSFEGGDHRGEQAAAIDEYPRSLEAFVKQLTTATVQSS